MMVADLFIGGSTACTHTQIFGHVYIDMHHRDGGVWSSEWVWICS